MCMNVIPWGGGGGGGELTKHINISLWTKKQCWTAWIRHPGSMKCLFDPGSRIPNLYFVCSVKNKIILNWVNLCLKKGKQIFRLPLSCSCWNQNSIFFSWFHWKRQKKIGFTTLIFCLLDLSGINLGWNCSTIDSPLEAISGIRAPWCKWCTESQHSTVHKSHGCQGSMN